MLDDGTIGFAPSLDGIPVLKDDGITGWYVPCGKCLECLRRRKNDWFVRTIKELSALERGFKVFMCTFTFSEDFLPSSRQELSAYLRSFKDRLRKAIGYFPMHWMISERGQTARIHFHGVLVLKGFTPFETVRHAWKYGFSWLEELKDFRGISYSLKYMLKGLIDRYANDDPLVGFVYCTQGWGSHVKESFYRWVLSSSQYSYNRIMTLTECGKLFRYAVPRYYIYRCIRMFGFKKYAQYDDWLDMKEKTEASFTTYNRYVEYRSFYTTLMQTFNKKIRNQLDFA